MERMVMLKPNRPRAPATHVLMVEDDFRVGEPLSLLLSMQGYYVSWAVSGEEALDVARDRDGQEPDIILLDLNLPDTDGVRLAHALRAYLLKAPIVMVSGQPRYEIASASLRMGAAVALQKPVPPAQVISAIGGLLAAADSERATRNGARNGGRNGD